MTVNQSPPCKGLIVSAPNSRAGKTTVALGLMRALSRRGLTVQPFKTGPDYIDPAFHKAASNRQSINLDAFAMRGQTMQALIAKAAAQSDICIAEGAMGLFDGAPQIGQYATGATADIAALTGWPVILVLDVARQAATAAAIVKGCATYRSDVDISAVILNNVASERHEALIKAPIEELGIRVIASLRRQKDVVLPERHLGLVQAVEHVGLNATIDACANLIESAADIGAITKLARPARFSLTDASSSSSPDHAAIPPPGQRIAIASDAAFSFMYPHICESWRSHGAQLLPFSPLADKPPAHDADVVWLPGGYPELHAAKLASASKFKNGIRDLAARAIPIHGECGGYMVLGRGLEDADGTRHEMLGLLALETSFAKRTLHLGYRKSNLAADCVLGRKDQIIFGHEFHYATIISNDDAPLGSVFDAQGTRLDASGSRRGHITGTFFHLIDRQAP